MGMTNRERRQVKRAFDERDEIADVLIGRLNELEVEHGRLVVVVEAIRSLMADAGVDLVLRDDGEGGVVAHVSRREDARR